MRWFYAGLPIVLLLASCGEGGHGGVLHRVKEAEAASANGGLNLAAEFDNARLVPVEAGAVHFQIRSREAAMEKFPCQRCHKVPLQQMKHDGKDGKTKAHWNLQLKHANKAVMNCATCHDTADLNRLKTVAGEPVAINASWQVCSQCHFKQGSDWAAGAHGKRVVGWAPPRVSKTCVECHNPHQPAWDHRLPVHVALTGVADNGRVNGGGRE